MSEWFVYRRGNGAKRRVMHLASFDRLGSYAGPLCGTDYPLNTSCNLPLGLRVCKRCLKAEAALRARSEAAAVGGR